MRRVLRGRGPVYDPTAWKTRRYERTKRRVFAGDLPRLAGFRIWSWVAEIQHDVDVGGTIVLRLHPECFRAWSVED